MSVRKKINIARKKRRESWNNTRIDAGSTEALCFSQRSESAKLAKVSVKQRTENRHQHNKPTKLDRRRSEHDVNKPVLHGSKLWVLRGVSRKHTRQVKEYYPDAFWSCDLKAFCWLKK